MAWAESYLHTKWHLNSSNHLATTDMGQKLGAVPLWEREAGSPCNTMWPGPRPIRMPSFILIHPTVWPQYTNVTDRQDRTDRQRSDSIRRIVSQTVAQKTAEPIDLPFELLTRVGRRKHKFNRICQVALTCPHGRAHWRHLANTIEPSICGGDVVFCQFTLTTCLVSVRFVGFVT